MKNLIKNIWEAPASTIAGALIAGATVLTSQWIGMPTWVVISIGAVSAFLGALSGSNKQTK